MSWWGKAVGGGLGYMLGGYLGALIGTVLGHQVDKGNTNLEEDEDWQHGSKTRVQTVFFTATFSVMGHLAKADGRVSEAEINHARAVMQRMSLSDTQKQFAIELFTRGKDSHFDLLSILSQLKREAGGRRHLLQLFLEIQIDAMLSDGQLHEVEQQLLLKIALQLGFNAAQLAQLITLVSGESHLHDENESADKKRAAAYAILGANPDTSIIELKKIYRRLMAQHHPDKLIAQGLPEEMIKAATRRVQEIQDAYHLIVDYRKQH